MGERASAGRDVRIVVCGVGGHQSPLLLPESNLDGPPFVSGGVRSLYELAVGAAALGFDVELRGDINQPILRALTDAAGAGPRTDLAPRPPEPGEIIVFPEAGELSIMATVALSGARGVIMLLAPPGLWGWTFLSGWTPGRAEPLTVPIDSLAPPETYRAIASLGFTMWTNAHGVAVRGATAGATVRWIGTGTPVPVPEPPPRTYDVAVVANNRWYALARQVADQLDGVRVLEVPPIPNQYTLSADLAPASILIWPSRIEGMSRIAREARAVGTIPITLDTNPFATPDDHGGGVVLVPDLDALRQAVGELLADPIRRAALAEEGITSARAQADWPSFLGRLEAALADLVAAAPDEQAATREVLGADLRTDIGRLDARLAASAARTAALEAELAETRDDRDALFRELAAIRRRRAVRLANRVGELRRRGRDRRADPEPD